MIRPLGVTILAAFVVVQGLVNIALVASSGSIGPGQLYFALTGVSGFVAAYGMMRGKMWGRYLMLLLAVLNILLGLLGTFMSLDTAVTQFEGFTSVLANLIVVYYLLRPDVVAYFKGFYNESFS